VHVSPALSLLQRVALDWDSLYLVQHWQPAVPVQSDELMLPDIGFSFYLFPIFVSFLFSPLSLSFPICSLFFIRFGFHFQPSTNAPRVRLALGH